jgi:amidase
MGFDGVVMPHPPILRGIQLVVDKLRRAGHTVVEWQPYKHEYASDLIGLICGADGGEDIRNAVALSGEPLIPNIANVFGPEAKKKVDLNDMWNIQIKKYKYQQEYLSIWMERNEVNGWIQPVAAHAAIKHDQYKYFGYSSVVNLLDYPAVVVPVTFAAKEIDIKDMNYKGISDLDAQVHDDYQADFYDSAPVALQIIGRRLQEEYVIGLAEQVGRALASL